MRMATRTEILFCGALGRVLMPGPYGPHPRLYRMLDAMDLAQGRAVEDMEPVQVGVLGFPVLKPARAAHQVDLARASARETPAHELFEQRVSGSEVGAILVVALLANIDRVGIAEAELAGDHAIRATHDIDANA